VFLSNDLELLLRKTFKYCYTTANLHLGGAYMAGNITKISFFQPIDRERVYSSAPNKLLWALYDEVIDNIFSSPFATKCYQVRQVGLNNSTKKNFTVLNASVNHSYGYLGYLVAKITVLYGLIYYPRFTLSSLAIGLGIKYYVRSNEAYYSPIARDDAPLQQPVVPPISHPQVSQEQRQKNLLKWMQKWMCDSYFPLFALGMTEASIIPSEGPIDETFVRVYIGEQFQNYPRSFLMQLPFFSALMGSGMSDVSDEGILLTPSFPYTHVELTELQRRLSSSDASDWGDLEPFDFLCLGMRSEGASYVEEMGTVQTAILSGNPAEMIPYLQRSSQNRSLETGPGVKAGAYYLEFLPSLQETSRLEEIQEIGPRVQATIESLNSIIRSSVMGNPQKHFYCNKLIQELINFHHDKRDSEVDILGVVINVIERSKAQDYITVLNLPANVKFSSGLLPRLLAMLPKLYWLQIDLFFEELVLEPEIGQRPSDFGAGHQALRVLSMNQRFSEEQRERLKVLFPNVDVMETD